ncbi:MAG: hypothetical protein FJX72_07995, partial [Armatimonadetes bacterium]|nr:hypothetical protein [Armatimonadota bacterium]
MYSTLRLARAGVLAAVIGMAIAAAIPVRAQDTDVSGRKVTLNLENADIRYALKMLFEMVSVNYVLEENVQGAVTASLSDVTFRVALENILKATQSQLPLTYRVQDNVYTVSLKQEVIEDQSTTGTTEETTPEKKTRTVKIAVTYA